MYIEVLITDDVDIESFYITEDDERIELFELEDYDINTYLICGINFNSYEEIYEDEVNSKKIGVLITNKSEDIYRDYSEDEWDSMVKEYVEKNKGKYHTYLCHTDAFVC